MTQEERIKKINELASLLHGLTVDEAQDLLYATVRQIALKSYVDKEKFTASNDDGDDGSNPPGGPGTPP